MIPGMLFGVPRGFATTHFPSKNDEKIDAKIDAEKVMKFHENSMRK